MKKDFGPITRRLRQVVDEIGGRKTSASQPADLVETVERQIDAISRGDYDAALACAHPDVELDIFAPPEFPWMRRARGLTELRRALEQNFASLEQQQPEILNVVAQGDVVVLIGRERGRIRATGVDYEVEFVHRFTFRDRSLIALRVIVAKAV